MKKNNELVVVDVNGSFTSVWNFCDADNALEEIERAQKSAAEDVATYESHIKKKLSGPQGILGKLQSSV